MVFPSVLRSAFETVVATSANVSIRVAITSSEASLSPSKDGGMRSYLYQSLAKFSESVRFVVMNQ